MSCSCNIVGKSEVETLKKELRWLSGWTQEIIRSFESAIDIIVSHNDKTLMRIDPSNVNEVRRLISETKRNVFTARGFLTDLNSTFSLNDSAIGYRILDQVTEHAEEFRKQCEGTVMVPVEEKKYTVKPKNPPTDFERTKFKQLITQLHQCRDSINVMLDNLYEGNNHVNVCVGLGFVDDFGNEVELPDLNPDEIVTELTRAKLEAASQALASKEPTDDGAKIDSSKPKG